MQGTVVADCRWETVIHFIMWFTCFINVCLFLGLSVSLRPCLLFLPPAGLWSMEIWCKYLWRKTCLARENCVLYFCSSLMIYFWWPPGKGRRGKSSSLSTELIEMYIYIYLHLVILQTLLSKATYNWGLHKAIKLEEANRQRKCP